MNKGGSSCKCGDRPVGFVDMDPHRIVSSCSHVWLVLLIIFFINKESWCTAQKFQRQDPLLIEFGDSDRYRSLCRDGSNCCKQYWHRLLSPTGSSWKIYCFPISSRSVMRLVLQTQADPCPGPGLECWIDRFRPGNRKNKACRASGAYAYKKYKCK